MRNKRTDTAYLFEEKKKLNERIFGLTWREILEDLNAPDYMDSILGLRDRAKILNISVNTLLSEYKKNGIKLRNERYPKLFGLRDIIYVKTGLTLEQFFKLYRHIFSFEELAFYLSIPSHAIEYAANAIGYDYGKIYNHNRNTSMVDRLLSIGRPFNYE